MLQCNAKESYLEETATINAPKYLLTVYNLLIELSQQNFLAKLFVNFPMFPFTWRNLLSKGQLRCFIPEHPTGKPEAPINVIVFNCILLNGISCNP